LMRASPTAQHLNCRHSSCAAASPLVVYLNGSSLFVTTGSGTELADLLKLLNRSDSVFLGPFELLERFPVAGVTFRGQTRSLCCFSV